MSSMLLAIQHYGSDVRVILPSYKMSPLLWEFMDVLDIKFENAPIVYQQETSRWGDWILYLAMQENNGIVVYW